MLLKQFRLKSQRTEFLLNTLVIGVVTIAWGYVIATVLGDQAVAQQVQERLKAVFGLIHDIEAARQVTEKNFDKIPGKASDDRQMQQQRLKALCTAVNDTEKETELVRKALGKIHEIRTIKNERLLQARYSGYKQTFRRGTLMKMLQGSAQTLPLWVGKVDEKAPPLCGAIPAEPSYVAKPGDKVAALVKGAEDEENWILAEVVSFDPSSHKYEVDDIDEEQKDKHVLSKRRVVPLPLMRANPGTDMQALFPVGTIVMALYPQTTCFYKAIVKQLPKKSTDDYEVLFEDTTYPDGYSPPFAVAQRYVIAIKEKKKQ